MNVYVFKWLNQKTKEQAHQVTRNTPQLKLTLVFASHLLKNLPVVGIQQKKDATI